MPPIWTLARMMALAAATLSLACAPATASEAPAAPAEMKIVDARIPMPDGVHLAADLFVAQGDDLTRPHPVLLEYLPYRKAESRPRNLSLYAPFVRAGYVVARVDIRGTGQSEGVLVPQEYSDIELNDGERVIGWLASQRWSSGAVGMFGISWGGFNAIQMTLRHPPALKAILAVDATEDLYAEDVHYIDGILHLDSWEMSQDLDNARPGAPDYRIDEAYFRDRFDQPPWMLATKREQRMGPYWARASASGRYREINTPMYLIGGWYDGYRSSIGRFLREAHCPVKAMIGPWTHAWPHEGGPGPAIEWRGSAIRWFDHWLRGADNGILAEPRLAVFVREAHGPGPRIDRVKGHWRWEQGRPLPSNAPGARVREATWHLRADHRLSPATSRTAMHALRYQPSAGVEAGGPVLWWGDVAPDQRPTDAQSLVYDSAPLPQPLEILGRPRAMLAVSASAPQANWFVRLSDVAPDGSVTLVTGVGINGTHRVSSSAPRDVVPGQRMSLQAELHATSWVFPKGHRVRASIGNAQWPMLWPTPYRMDTTLFVGGTGKNAGSRISLPVVRHRDGPGPVFEPPPEEPAAEGFATLDGGTDSGFGEVSGVERDADGLATVTLRNAGGMRYPWGTERTEERIEHRLRDDMPQAAQTLGTHRTIVELRDGRTLEWESQTDWSSDLDHLRFHYVRRLRIDGTLIREKTWDETIPRDHQ